jgi:tRNA(Ile)-lysidine synthase
MIRHGTVKDDHKDWQDGETRAYALTERLAGAGVPHPAVCAWLEGLPDSSAPILVAVSGGADSTAVLLLFWAWFPALRERLAVVHFDHGVRGEASRLDAKRVEVLAKSLSLPFHLGEREPADQAAAANETVLREARLKWFERVREQTGAVALVTGHHRNDVVETFLLRLARSAGSSGLAAPRPVQPHRQWVFLRPLLNLTHDAITAALAGAGVEWSEDVTNEDERHPRNALRRRLLPLWREVAGPAVEDAVARSRAWLEEDDNALHHWLNQVMPATSFDDPVSLDLGRLHGLPLALARRALLRWWYEHLDGVDATPVRVEPLLEAWAQQERFTVTVAPGLRLMLKADGKLRVQRDRVVPDYPATSWSPRAGGGLYLPDGARLEGEWVALDDASRGAILSGQDSPDSRVWLEETSCPEGMVIIRPWQPGDRYESLGAPGTRKVREAQIDKKIPLEERSLLPVVCNLQDNILWVPGLPPAGLARVTASSKRAMRLTYHSFRR